MAAKMILLIIMIAFRSEGTTRGANRRHRILDVIASPTHYNKAIPPFPNDTSPVVVRTNMKFSHCSLDDLTMLLQIDLTITMKWQDYRFSSDIPEPSIHFSDASNFWVPRGFFKDNFEMVQRSEDIKIITTGEVSYTVDVTATLHCPLNLKRFPHDRQICPIQFSTYSSTEDLILLYEDIGFVRPPSLLRYYLRGTRKGHCNFKTPSGPVVVRTNMKFSHCSLDDLTMLLQIDLTITMKWQDYRFSSDIPEPSIHFSDASNFWVPRGFFKDNFEMVQRSEDIKIITTGEVLYTVDVTATLHCPLNLKRFPHDRQICPIQFSTYSSTEDLILLYEDIEFVRPPSLPRYYLRGTRKGHCNFKTPSGVYACLKADLFLERKFSTYLFEWYVPCACFVIISFCSLFMKTSCFLARLVLTLGPLLSLILSSLNYYRNLPRVTHFTALDEFTGTSCFFAFVIFIYVIISHIFGGSKTTEEEEGSDTDSVSKWRRLYRVLKHMFGRIVKTALVVCYLSFLVGYYFVYRDSPQEEDDEEQSNIQYY